MANQIYINAYNAAVNYYNLMQRATKADLYEAAGFYMRKSVECLVNGFIEEYKTIDGARDFKNYCKAYNYSNASLDAKVDYLIMKHCIPANLKGSYDRVRKYGNLAVHKLGFGYNPNEYVNLESQLCNMLNGYYQFAINTC